LLGTVFIAIPTAPEQQSTEASGINSKHESFVWLTQILLFQLFYCSIYALFLFLFPTFAGSYTLDNLSFSLRMQQNALLFEAREESRHHLTCDKRLGVCLLNLFI